MGQQGRPAKDDNTTTNTNPDAEILEQGDIYFFYRPKKAAEEVKGVEDVRRFFMVTAPEKRKAGREGEAKEEDFSADSSKSQLYRLFVIGKKSLPEVRKTEARASERYWARVGGVFLKMLMNLQRNFYQTNLEEEMPQDQLEKESML